MTPQEGRRDLELKVTFVYWAQESKEQGKDGVLVRYPQAGPALILAEGVAKEKGRELLDQWPRAISRDGAMHWFFEYKR